MNIEEKIDYIKVKINELRKLDKNYEVFGASSHSYLLNKKIDQSSIIAFEEKYSITLPLEYRMFIIKVGDGGAGPYYGLQTLNDSLYVDLDYKRAGDLVNPSVAFPFKEPWNMIFEGDEEDDFEYEKFQSEYFSEKWGTGVLKICNFGCAVTLNLVVNGPEKGNIWVDDRANDGGIYPDNYFEQVGRTTFLDWYILWINRSFKELDALNDDIPQY